MNAVEHHSENWDAAMAVRACGAWAVVQVTGQLTRYTQGGDDGDYGAPSRTTERTENMSERIEDELMDGQWKWRVIFPRVNQRGGGGGGVRGSTALAPGLAGPGLVRMQVC